MSIFKICVLTLSGARLTYTVKEYTVDDGGFIHFLDAKTMRNLRFHASRCEIEEVVA